MKKYILCLFAITLMMVSCGNNNKQPANSDLLNAETDSTQLKEDPMQEFIELMATSLDSIQIEEGYLLTGGPDGQPLNNREKIKQHLANIKKLIAHQHQRIDDLNKALTNNKSANATKIKRIIASYEKQLQQKDALIAKLTKEVDDRNFDIADLRYTVKNLDRDNYELQRQNEEKDMTISDMDQEINRFYVIVGDKSTLKKTGLLKGGSLFKKKKLDPSQFNSALFDEVDKRNFTTLKISGKKPKVLTQMPTSSYKIEDNGDGTSTLTVLDPDQFWNVSNYLVIQIN